MDKTLLNKILPPIVVLTCIDARLIGVLEEKLQLPPKSFFMLKTAGAAIFEESGEIMFSLLLATRVIQCRTILVIGHTDCAFAALSTGKLKQNLNQFLPKGKLEQIFSVAGDEAIITLATAEKIRNSSLIPEEVSIYPLLFDLNEGSLQYLQPQHAAG
jgi:carbonic anhydrase